MPVVGFQSPGVGSDEPKDSVSTKAGILGPLALQLGSYLGKVPKQGQGGNGVLSGVSDHRTIPF